MNKKIPMLENWKNPGDTISGKNKEKIITMHFDKIFGVDSDFQKIDFNELNKFIIAKTAYNNNIKIIVDYISYFIKFYDNDQELPLGYLKLKVEIDKEDSIYNSDNVDRFIDDIYNILITPSILKELDDLIEYNNKADIERDDDGTKIYKTNKIYSENLEFNNEHVHLLHKISYCIKIIIPIMSHYIVKNGIKINDPKYINGIIYKFFEPLFGPKISDKIDIYNKLYVYVKVKIQEHRSLNANLYNQRDILGEDVTSQIQDFLRKKLISDVMFKYSLSSESRSNLVGFNKTAIRKQLAYYIQDKYKKNLTLLTDDRNSEGLSGIEKLEMRMSKIDEGSMILADMSAEVAIKEIQNYYKMDISKEEIDYMVKNHNPCEVQQRIITGFFSKFFGESRNVKLVNKSQYCIMSLILKKILLTSDANNENDTNISFLPFILTGNLQGNQENRPIKNSKFISKLESTPAYQSLIQNKFKCIEEIRPNTILNLISTLTNSVFTYCVYEYPEMLGEKININTNKLAVEIITLLSAI